MLRLRTRVMKTRQSNNDPWVQSVVKSNVDLEPAFDAVDNLAECIGVVVDGDTTDYSGGATEGQYVILRNSTITGCDDGLYTVATGKSISAGSPIDATFLTAVNGGGLNSLKNSLSKVISNYGFATKDTQTFSASREGTYLLIIRIQPASGNDGLHIRIYLNGNLIAQQASPQGAPLSITIPIILKTTDVVTIDFAESGSLNISENECNMRSLVFLSDATTVL